jgi:outer membrane protein OmpA-like peptidoglycan-associated protein
MEFFRHNYPMQKIMKIAFLAVFTSVGLPFIPSAYAVADGPVNCGTSGTFTITNNVVTGNTGCTGTVVVPSGVTEIASGALNSASITSITIASSVTSIGNAIFNGSTTVTKNCGTSGNFTISSKIVSLGRNAAGHGYCSGTVVVPEGVTSIGNSAFYGNNTITTVSLPTTLTTIADQSFRTTSITSVNIPASVTYVGYLTFSNNLRTLASVNFQGTAASSALTVGNTAFQYVALTTITFPANLATLDPSVFDATNSLQSIRFLGNAPSVSTNFTSIANSPTVYAKSSATGFTSPTWKGLNFVSVAPPSFSYASSPVNATVGNAVTNSTVTSTGDTVTSYSISPAISNTPGLSFDSAVGTFTGTPTTVATSLTYTITGTGSFGETGTSTYAITVNAASVATASAPVIKVPTLKQPPLELAVDKDKLSWGMLAKLTLTGGVDSGTVTYQNSGDSYCLVDAASKQVVTTKYGTCIITAYNSGDSDYIGIQSNPIQILVTENAAPEVNMNKMSSIYFASGSYRLNSASKLALNKLAISIKSNNPTEILSYGFTDSKGGADNTYLSKMRAKTVADYLKLKGVNTEITLGWYADSNPADSGTTKAALAKNRRVEIYIK